mgnify:CR=1 FL=1
MPWKPKDAQRHTRKADTAAKQKLWTKIANSTLRRTGDEARAIREANAVMRRKSHK